MFGGLSFMVNNKMIVGVGHGGDLRSIATCGAAATGAVTDQSRTSYPRVLVRYATSGWRRSCSVAISDVREVSRHLSAGRHRLDVCGDIGDDFR
jgi:hypothetical protein